MILYVAFAATLCGTDGGVVLVHGGLVVGEGESGLGEGGRVR